MADLTFLTSATSVEANRALIDELIVKQGLHPVAAAQIGRSMVAIPCEGILATVFAVVPREDGGFALRVSLYNKEAGFKLAGWIVAYPTCIEMSENRAVVRVSDQELAALESFTKEKSLFFDLSSTKFISVKLAIGVDKHYVKDASGNRVPAGTDATGKPAYALEEHQVLTFSSGYINAPLAGSGVSGGGCTKDEVNEAEAYATQLMAAAATSGRSL